MPGPLHIASTGDEGLRVAVQHDEKGRMVGIIIEPEQPRRRQRGKGEDVNISIVVDHVTHMKLRLCAIESKRKLKAILFEAVNEWLEQHKSLLKKHRFD
jgi:hypothetical protein